MISGPEHPIPATEKALEVLLASVHALDGPHPVAMTEDTGSFVVRETRIRFVEPEQEPKERY